MVVSVAQEAVHEAAAATAVLRCMGEVVAMVHRLSRHAAGTCRAYQSSDECANVASDTVVATEEAVAVATIRTERCCCAC